MVHKVAIIGAGPAGIAAALQLKRFGIDFIWFEKDQIGGLLHNANLVENYLGFPNGIKGEKLISLFKKQIEMLDIEPTYDEVISLEYDGNSFNIKTKTDSFYTERVILASGTVPIITNKYPDDISEKICFEVKDLKGVIDSDIITVGAGDASFDYALNLSQNNQVTILNRSEKIKALKVLMNRVLNNSKIIYLTNTEIQSISIENDKLLLTCNSEKSTLIKSCDYLLFAIGRKPGNGFLDRSIKDSYQQLIGDKKLFPIGDIKNESKRQTSISTGNGIEAAMEIFELLSK